MITTSKIFNVDIWHREGGKIHLHYAVDGGSAC
jgi:hypothetical protein